MPGWKWVENIFFWKDIFENSQNKNPQVNRIRLSYFGEVQKVRFLGIFSKARNKQIFLRKLIKTQRKVLITLNSLYLIILNALKENRNFYNSFKCFHKFGLVNVTLGSKKTHKNEPCLGSFVARGDQNQIKPICFLESSAHPYNQQKKSKRFFLSLKKEIKFQFWAFFSFLVIFKILFFWLER
jgi:hypothetical protein